MRRTQKANMPEPIYVLPPIEERKLYLASEAFPGDGVSQPYRVVLMRRATDYEPYVTWLQHPQEKHTYWGHYFSDPVEALKDYLERCANYGLDPCVIDVLEGRAAK